MDQWNEWFDDKIMPVTIIGNSCLLVGGCVYILIVMALHGYPKPFQGKFYQPRFDIIVVNDG